MALISNRSNAVLAAALLAGAAFASPLFVFAQGQMAAQDAAAQNAAATSAKPVKGLKVLSAAEVDIKTILPAPPEAGSVQQTAELAELRDIQRLRTAARLDQAHWDDAHEDATAFAAVIGPKFDLKTLPQTAKLLELVQNDQEVLATEAKAYFHRARPFVVDDSLVGCDRGKKFYTSYPSGHATMAYTLAPVLSALMPQKSEEIEKRAEDYVFSRLVCEVHYRSDLRAGRILGSWAAIQLLRAPSLQPQIAAARAELVAAGLTTP